MAREFGHMPIMSHYQAEVRDPSEILDGWDRPRRVGEIEIDLTSMAQLLVDKLKTIRDGLWLVYQTRYFVKRTVNSSVADKTPNPFGKFPYLQYA